jgi:AcrR family transcriptional regulator
MQSDCNVAARLQHVPAPVNATSPDRRTARVRATERQILVAAHRLFVERGWTATTLADVAATADVAERTVYVRFGTKAALLRRVIEVAVAGDDEPQPVRDREWYRVAATAPTLAARIDAFARGAAALLSRAAPVIAVALQAMGLDRDLAATAAAGHAHTREDLSNLWGQAHRDGLLPAHVDAEWFATTVSVIGQADVYLLGRELYGWTPEDYEGWLRTTLRRLLA